MGFYLKSVLSNKVKYFGENDVLNSKWCKINALQIPHLLSDSIRQIPPVTTYTHIPLFRNKRFALNEMFQRNASKFPIFYVSE